MTISYHKIKSPLGKLTLGLEGEFICGLWFSDKYSERLDSHAMHPNCHPVRPSCHSGLGPESRSAALSLDASLRWHDTQAQIQEYFSGQRKVFDLPIKLKGTEFQKRVWQALLTIPYGETRSYKQIAEQIGCPKGYRAIGLANSKNPISIIVPCHRVINSNKSLGGYAGGLDNKRYLLGLENA